MNKKQLASQQTRKRLKEAFMELYSAQDAPEVTINALTKKAGHNRSTFYNYFDSMDELLHEIEDDILQMMKTQIFTISTYDENSLRQIFSNLVSFFDEYGDTVFALMGKNGDPAFRYRMKELLIQSFKAARPQNTDPEMLEYIYSYLISVSISLSEQWYATGKKLSSEEFLRLVQVLVFSGLMGLAEHSRDNYKNFLMHSSFVQDFFTKMAQPDKSE